ncbi:hypothetical protein P355_1281 [Burkholderia cenocepacia KC-01]|nr:hypothetical protein P355_1281 [Burkholderia cenocepacia KC-01]
MTRRAVVGHGCPAAPPWTAHLCSASVTSAAQAARRRPARAAVRVPATSASS